MKSSKPRIKRPTLKGSSMSKPNASNSKPINLKLVSQNKIDIENKSDEEVNLFRCNSTKQHHINVFGLAAQPKEVFIQTIMDDLDFSKQDAEERFNDYIQRLVIVSANDASQD
jgi:hypothetical protein